MLYVLSSVDQIGASVMLLVAIVLAIIVTP